MTNQGVYGEPDWFSYNVSEQQHTYLKDPHKVTTGAGTMPGRLVCNTGQLLMEITAKGVNCQYNNFNNNVLF